MKHTDAAEFLQRIGTQLKKFRFAALILLLGLLLLLIPAHEDIPGETQTVPETTNPLEECPEQRLERLLSQVDGAGCVAVMLTVSREKETVYQQDETTQQHSDGASVTLTTVLVSQDSSEEKPLEVTVNGPQYLGAVVVAEGGHIPSVRLDLVNAVSSLTGLGADKITVIKMKAK